MNELKEKQSILAKIVEFVIKTNITSLAQNKILEEEEEDMMGSGDKKKDRRFRKKNELSIENNSSMMMDKIGSNIRKTIISRPTIFQK